MDPKTLKVGDRIAHPDFGEGVFQLWTPMGNAQIDWDRQGSDCWSDEDGRWEQVELA